jgi:hypothetical protein
VEPDTSLLSPLSVVESLRRLPLLPLTVKKDSLPLLATFEALDEEADVRAALPKRTRELLSPKSVGGTHGERPGGAGWLAGGWAETGCTGTENTEKGKTGKRERSGGKLGAAIDNGSADCGNSDEDDEVSIDCAVGGDTGDLRPNGKRNFVKADMARRDLPRPPPCSFSSGWAPASKVTPESPPGP